MRPRRGVLPPPPRPRRSLGGESWGCRRRSACPPAPPGQARYWRCARVLLSFRSDSTLLYMLILRSVGEAAPARLGPPTQPEPGHGVSLRQGLGLLVASSISGACPHPGLRWPRGYSSSPGPGAAGVGVARLPVSVGLGDVAVHVEVPGDLGQGEFGPFQLGRQHDLAAQPGVLLKKGRHVQHVVLPGARRRAVTGGGGAGTEGAPLGPAPPPAAARGRELQALTPRALGAGRGRPAHLSSGGVRRSRWSSLTYTWQVEHAREASQAPGGGKRGGASEGGQRQGEEALAFPSAPALLPGPRLYPVMDSASCSPGASKVCKGTSRVPGLPRTPPQTVDKTVYMELERGLDFGVAERGEVRQGPCSL